MPEGDLTAAEFVAHWRGKNLPERGVSQSHFIQLCRLLDVAAPHTPGTKDEEYCFEALTASAGSREYARARGKGKRIGKGEELFGGSGEAAPITGGPVIGGTGEGTSRVVRAPEGTRGWCDVWMNERFCWEYKRQDKGYADLDAAMRQLREYKDSLNNPPLLIACDIDRFLIVTNFTNRPTKRFEFGLEELSEPSAHWREDHGVSPLQMLRYAFTKPGWFEPRQTNADVTEDLAKDVGELAVSIGKRKDAGGRTSDPHDVAHFLMQVIFSLFAEDVGLLPDDRIGRLCRARGTNPELFRRQIAGLFAAMETGGFFGDEEIKWFNGGLFRDVDRQRIPTLLPADIDMLAKVAGSDWSAIEPSILGTLFERSLDPEKRAQIGAHYTSREDIMLIIEPVVMRPLRREWEAVQAEALKSVERRAKSGNKEIGGLLKGFHDRLCSVRVLDPACGSGNFLYVAIQCLLGLEKEVILFGARAEVGVRLEPRVGPAQLRGVEINPYAAELARISIWIGYLKWQRENGEVRERKPILDNLDAIEERDAILKWKDARGKDVPRWEEGAACAGAAAWPEAEFIIGNPPFLGSKLFRKWGLSDGYLEGLYAAYDLPKTSDLCCYWFELARRAVERGKGAGGAAGAGTPNASEGVRRGDEQADGDAARGGARRLKKAGDRGGRTGQEPPSLRSGFQSNSGGPRVGLLATQGIRGGDNRTVLERIKETGDIFMAWSDREWVLDGAAVHVSMVGFDDGAESERVLDGNRVETVNANLSATTDTPQANPLPENSGFVFMGTTKGGAFEIDVESAADLIAQVGPGKKKNSDVVVPWINGSDVTDRNRGLFIIDFGCESNRSDAVLYEAPFRHLERFVKAERSKNRRAVYAEKWWVHVEPRPALREAINGLNRFIVTTRVAKYRLFRWFEHPTLPDSATFVFARSDDYFFGVLHSCVHELWARRMGTQLREVESGFRYTPTTCFETFALPWAPGREPVAGPGGASLNPDRKGGGSGRGQPSGGGRGARGGATDEGDKRAARTVKAGTPFLAGGVPEQQALWRAIGEAARELNELRENWLNPAALIGMVEKQVEIKYREELRRIGEMECPRPGLTQSGETGAPVSVKELVRRSAVMAEAAKHPELKKRTLTNLYNERPAWLRLAHEKLDRAVLAAYAAVDPPPGGGWDVEWAKVYEPFGAGEIVIKKKGKTGRAAVDGPAVVEAKSAAIQARAAVDEKILGALLRLNRERAVGE